MIRIAMGFLVGALVLVTDTAGAQEPQRSSEGVAYVEVTGFGESAVAPDRATVMISVETYGARAASVAAENAQIQARVLDTLRTLGFAGDMVSTLQYNVAPNYARTETGQRQEGYIARNAVRVRLSDLGRIGSVIDASLARGATGVGGVRFEASNTDAARREALAGAARQARGEAEALAAAMGGRLGPLLSVSTSRTEFYGRVSGLAGGYAMRETPISPSDIVERAQVVARWRFLDR
jgi:hypothetical protein